MNNHITILKGIRSFLTRDKNVKKITLFIVICFLIAPIVSGFVYLGVFSVNIPYWDQWGSDISLGISFHKGVGNLNDLLFLHNDHRPVVPLTLMIVSHLITNFNIISEIFMSYIFYIIAFVILSLIFLKKYNYHPFMVIPLIPVSFYYFNLYELGSLLWGLSIFYSVFLVSITAMFFSLDQNKGIDLWFLIAIISAIVCMFSFSSGIFIWIGGIFTILLKNDMFKKLKLIIWLAVSTGCFYINYILLEFRSTGIHGIEGYRIYLYNFILYPFHKFLCFIGTIGSNIIHDVSYTIFAGILIFLVSLTIIIVNRKNLDLSDNAIWYGMIAYLFSISVLLTLSRSGNGGIFGPVDMVLFIPDIRHFPSTILLLISLFFLVINYCVRDVYNCFFKPMKENKKIDQVIKVCNNCILVGIILSMLIFGSFFHVIPGIQHGGKWFMENLNNSQNFIFYEEKSSEILQKIYPDPAVITNTAKYFRENSLNVFDPEKKELYINYPQLNWIRDKIFNSEEQKFYPNDPLLDWVRIKIS